ncbi:MAG: putative Histidine kinase [Bacteroidetes bacterium]|nr:putative Histidine kinase [Bacteroidota bacterium]
MDELKNVKLELSISKKKELVLQHRVEELNDFIENAALPLHWVNGSGIIIWANQVELDMLGFSKEEYIGRHISNFHADKNAIEDILTRLVNKETLVNYPARLRTKNGEIKHVLINSNVLWKDNKFVHTRCFTRDISELKQIEAEKAEKISVLENENKRLQLENEKLKNRLREQN